MDDDFNAPMLVAGLFEAVKYINTVSEGNASITAGDLELLTKEMTAFVFDVLGLNIETNAAGSDKALTSVMDLVLDMRKDARENKDWSTSDKIRDRLTEAGIVVKDGKEGVTWTVK
ncbi:Cysteine--tRNA ligase [compost metagenome]